MKVRDLHLPPVSVRLDSQKRGQNAELGIFEAVWLLSVSLTEFVMAREKKRWQYRFDNFSRAYSLLQEAAERNKAGELDQLAKEGMIKRFRLCMELAWKTMKDYLESQSVVFSQVTPKAVLKESVAGMLISDGEGWMSALDARNKMSHTYDFAKFEIIIEDIQTRYLDCIGELYEKLSEAYLDIDND